MARRLRPDSVLFIATLVLVCLGIAWVSSASMGRARESVAATAQALQKQLLWAALGMATLSFVARVDYRTYRNRHLLVCLLGVTVVGLVAVLFAPAVGGARRWLGIGGLGVQPSEFAKLVALMVAALLLAERVEKHEPLNPALVRIGALLAVFSALIFFEKDLGSVVIMVAVLGILAFVAGLPYRYLLIAAGVSLPLGAIAIYVEEYRFRRVMAFLSGNEADLPFQTLQSLIAVGSGGAWGKGFGESVQKLFYLPKAQTDAIFAVIGEEAGLIGTTVVLACFAVIIWRGLRASAHAPDAFGALLATGTTALIGFQAALNMSVVLNLVPQKGVALPFVSYGGSSMLVSLTCMGILLNVSQHASVSRSGS